MWIDVPRKGVVVLALIGCGPTVDDPAGDGGGSGGAHDGAGNASGGGGENPYVGCAAGDFASSYLRTCSSAFGVTVEGVCAACLCHDDDCDRGSDCPAPAGSTPDCREGQCVLRCEDDGDCPGEMRCGTLNADESNVCADVVDDPLACAAEASEPGWPDPCPDLTDEASCEAVTSDLGYACKWSTQTLYQVPADECVPVEVTERCILTTSRIGYAPPPGECVAFGRCDATGTRVFFEDIGGGTVRLIAFDDCELQLGPGPGADGHHLEYCDYSGTTPLPIICGCACG
jgi:hypothetical protein